jgi:exopolysaccharide biosynthesis polyprenyl glycosylphosphotransferase
MLRRHSEIFRTALLLADLTLAGASWLAAYHIRFYAGIPAPLGIPDFGAYGLTLGLILPLWWLVFRARGLYGPRRTGSVLAEVGQVFVAVTSVVVIVVALTFFARKYFFSRGVLLLFYGISFVSVAGFRVASRKVIRELHRRGHSLSTVVVAGSGRLAEQVIDRIHQHPEAGLRVVGVLADERHVKRVHGVPVLGRYDQLKQILQLCAASQVILALPREESHHAERLLADLEDEVVDVRLVPDLMHVLTLRASVEDFGGLPVIGLRETPLVGWAAIQKRVFDVAAATLVLLIAAPLMAVIAVAVVATSGRPVFYRQERMGLDGRVFQMLKFRTMVPDAEKHGPVWARAGDTRTTRVGDFLRRTGLDELPQLWNVLLGDMSLVGPRPERPIFIEQFRREVPGYMLRHKVKAGLTGWAQVHRWRGDTSLQERIEHDLYYIQNWSLGLDLRILFMTVWRSRLPP